ncbi:MAG: hypothetical protein A3I78_06395 [Gammaproteobacteria bacterium RIFCSPLOWO2_02_FULL_56_15]|nr:MAG: hypothetical protein A3I78_06395 [Gammaproteobacteria bacterium RIFCSPLOWO2_02_FULL_56_15]
MRTAHLRGARLWFLASTTLLFSALVSLLAAELAWRWYEQTISASSVLDPGLLRYHPRLGWVLNPGWRGSHRHHDFSADYQVNYFGFRGQPVSSGRSDRRRVALLGDSFTFGLGVNEAETFAVRMAEQDPATEYLNFGVPGYSTDQEYLLQQEVVSSFQPDLYLLFLYLGNDIIDNMLSVPLQVEQAKPFYRLEEGGQLRLQNVPVPSGQASGVVAESSLESVVYGTELARMQNPLSRILSSSRLLDRLLPDPHFEGTKIQGILDARLVEQRRLLAAIIREMGEYTAGQGSRLALVLLPGMSYVTRPASPSALFQDHVRLFILGVAADSGLVTVDIAAPMRERYKSGDKPDWFFPNEGHYTHDGHQVVADLLRRGLDLWR